LPCTAWRSGPGTGRARSDRLHAGGGSARLSGIGALSFEMFAAPLIARLEGTLETARPIVVHDSLARSLTGGSGRVGASPSRPVGGRLVATALPRGAGVLTSLVRADALLLIPAGAEGHDADAEVEVRLLRELGELENTIVMTGSDDVALDLAASALRSGNARLTLRCRTSARSVVLQRSGTGSAISPDHACSTPRRAGTRFPTSTRCSPGATSPLCGSPFGTRPHRRARQPARPERHRGPGARALRYVNRQPGSGTRALSTTSSLARHRTHVVIGYDREEHTHLR